jgi:hypothetical protein
MLEETLQRGVLGEPLRQVAFFPFPLGAGPVSPEEMQAIFAPVFVDLQLFSTEEKRAVSYHVTVYVDDLVMTLLAIEYQGMVYVSIEAMYSQLPWFVYGRLE